MRFIRPAAATYRSFVIIIAFAVFFAANAFAASAASGANISVKDANGPTLVFDFNDGAIKQNPATAFVYFIPLISPVLVDRQVSPDNKQQTAIISYEKKSDSKSFYVLCEFKLTGSGSHTNAFDTQAMIDWNLVGHRQGEALTNMLDYIRFEGEGVGCFEVRGRIKGNEKIVTEVNIHFNSKGHKSPVTVGLYSIKPKDGKYSYENRFNQLTARVNSLSFKKSDKSPRMSISIASVSKKPSGSGFWGSVKGAIANIFIKPFEVDKLGNDTMLAFGNSLIEKKPTFTFPKAKNIKLSNNG